MIELLFCPTCLAPAEVLPGPRTMCLQAHEHVLTPEVLDHLRWLTTASQPPPPA